MTIAPDILPDDIDAVKVALVGERAEPIIVTVKMNDFNPRAWFADVLARVAEHPPLTRPIRSA